MVYDGYRGIALKTVFRYIYHYDEALEVTNDGFVKFFLTIDRFSCDGEAGAQPQLIGWLKRIMINTAIDLLRKKKLLPEIGGIPEYVWEIENETANADAPLLYKDLVSLVKKLPPSLRIVFNMYVIDGYSHIEIADTLKIPVGTSKSNLSRAKTLMKEYLDQLDQKEIAMQCSI